VPQCACPVVHWPGCHGPFINGSSMDITSTWQVHVTRSMGCQLSILNICPKFEHFIPHLCVYMYICIYVCVYVYIYIHTCVYTYVYKYNTRTHTRTRHTCQISLAFEHFPTTRAPYSTPMYMYMYIHIYLYTYIFICMYMYIHINTHYTRTSTVASKPLPNA